MEWFKLSYTRSRRQRVISVLAAIIIFVTTYALILPAITIDTDTAEREPGLELPTENEAAPADDGTHPAVTMTDSLGELQVEVDAAAGVFPEDTSLVLREAKTETLIPMLESTLGARVAAAETVEIAFADENGEDVPPENAYSVRLTGDMMADPANLFLVEIKDGSAAVVENSEFTYRQVAFEADSGATYALVETKELQMEYLSASGNLYGVTVTYDVAAGIPEDASLILKEIEKDSSDYEDAKQLLLDSNVLAGDDIPPNVSGPGNTATLSLMSEDDDETDASPAIEGLDVLDISIVDADGNEIEPTAPVLVEIVMNSLPEDISENDFFTSATVTHIRETENGPEPEIVAGNNSGQPGAIAVENGEAVATFKTDSFSTYTITWGRTGGYRGTVHYGYYDDRGNWAELNQSQFSNGVPRISNSSSSTPNYLIYDVEGYEFDHAFLNSDTSSNQIQPYLSYGSNTYRYWKAGTALDGSYSGSLSSGNNIYMVYKPITEPVPSGKPKIYETSESPREPQIQKGSENLHDGTRMLSLSITGHEAPLEFERLVDVIVIFDVSGSMSTEIEGSTNSRLEAGKDALQFLADTLLSEERVNREGEKLNRMALITFSNSAQIVQEFTDDPDVFNESVEGLTQGGGTNWELPLHMANRMTVDPDRKTVVIFVSDGNPTWRMTRYNVSDAQLRNQSDMHTSSNNGYYRLYNVFGRGDSDNQGRNYDAALAEAQNIVGVQHKELYTIAIGPDVDKMARLTEDSGSGSNNAFTVQTESELTDAINRIEQSINGSYGWGNVQMNDGITGLTNLLAKTPLTGVDEANFTYTRIDKNGVESAWDPVAAGANPASYNHEDHAVEWYMGDNFQLEDGVTYKVSFRVWPDQDATDIVTDLNNGTLNYDDLTPEVQAQIQNSGGVYTVKTNEDGAHVTYCPSYSLNGQVTITGEPETLYFQPVEPLVVQTMPMTVEKIFRDSFGDETGDGIGADRPEEVHLTLERRPLGSDDEWEICWVTYENPEHEIVTDKDIWLSQGNEWKAQFWVSPGLWDADGIHRNAGYEYRLTEEETEYHYELISEYLNPYLQGHNEPVAGNDPALADEEVYVVRHYNGDTDGSESLTAANVVKGGINLIKHVNAPGANVDPDTEFTIRGWILDPDGNPYLFDQANDDRTDKSQKANPDTTPLFYLHQNDPLPYHFYDANGRQTVYKGHFDSTQYIEFKIKDGEQIRFPIIPTDCTYLFWEVDGDGMPTGFVLENVTGVAREKLDLDGDGEYEFVDSSDLSKYPFITDDNEVGGTIFGNTLFQLDFYNRYVQPNHITVNKKVTDAEGTAQIYPDAAFTVKGYIRNRFGLGFNFDPALDDRADKSQPLPESEYDTHTWDEHQDDPIAYNIIDKDGNYVVYKGHFPSTDQITFELRSGDTLEFLNVPAGCSYQFYEDTSDMEQPDSRFEYVSSSGEAVTADGPAVTQPTVFPNPDGFTVVAGTVYEDEEHDIRFVNKTNVSYVDLRIQKVDAENPELKLNGAKFMLYADADRTVLATDFNGNPIGQIVTGGFADAEQTQPLGIGYIGSLLPGTYYLVEEEPPPGLYNRIPGNIVVRVSVDGTSVYQPDNAAATGSAGVSVSEDGIVTITVTNTKGTELPHTGGPGTFLYTSGGILLLLTAALIYIFGLRRKERGEIDSG